VANSAKVIAKQKSLSEVDLRVQQSFAELRIDPETGLNPRYTLESFVVGSSNELAYTAAMAIIKDVGKKYNPLFIYGGVGLGKTHLLQSLGNEIKKEYNNKIKVFPNIIFARLFNFGEEEFFQAEEESKKDVKVNF